MNFNRGKSREAPEINLIPLIDVLLVVIIFLMLTTTYSRFSELEINLPTADTESQEEQAPNEIEVAVTATGQIVVNKQPLQSNEVNFIAEALTLAAAERTDLVIVISADAKATHQSVIDVMQAAQIAGFPHISFMTQNLPQ